MYHTISVLKAKVKKKKTRHKFFSGSVNLRQNPHNSFDTPSQAEMPASPSQGNGHFSSFKARRKPLFSQEV